jgi:hypothetical protein
VQSTFFVLYFCAAMPAAQKLHRSTDFVSNATIGASAWAAAYLPLSVLPMLS